MKRHAMSGLIMGLGLILDAGSSNSYAQHKQQEAIGQNLRQTAKHAEFASQHCEANADGKKKCLSFVGCREDQKAQKTICEWTWKWDIE